MKQRLNPRCLHHAQPQPCPFTTPLMPSALLILLSRSLLPAALGQVAELRERASREAQNSEYVKAVSTLEDALLLAPGHPGVESDLLRAQDCIAVKRLREDAEEVCGAIGDRLSQVCPAVGLLCRTPRTQHHGSLSTGHTPS